MDNSAINQPTHECISQIEMEKRLKEAGKQEQLYDAGNKTWQWIAEYGQSAKDQIRSAEDVIKASQQARASALSQNEALKAQAFSAKAGKAALKGLSAVANALASIGLTLAASKIVSSIYDMATANKQLLNSAKESGNGFVQEKDAINDYKNKIEELKSIIDDNSSSYDKASQAKKDLMAVQDELIKKFGTEKETIDIITNAIDDQSDALDELTAKQYQQWENEFNDKSSAQSFSDFISSGNIGNAIYKLTEFDFSGAWDMLTAPAKSNIDGMVDSMQYAYYKIKKSGNDTLDSLIAKTYNLQDTGSDFVLSGNLNDIHEDLLGIQEMSKDFNVSDRFEAGITKTANAMNNTLNSYKEAYDIYILNKKILDDSENNQYDEQFNLINKAKEAHDKMYIANNYYSSTLYSSGVNK